MPASEPVGSPHLQYVEALLKEVKRRRVEGGGDPTSSDWFLVRDEGATFWELVALQVRGYPSLLLGALRFQRQGGPGATEYARRPLAYHLSAPPRELGIDRTARPAWILELMVPDVHEDVPAFQARVQGGEEGRRVYFDAELIDLAFDFRFENPSAEREQASQHGVAERHLVRSIRGHVLSGISHGLHRRLNQHASFITLHSPVQHTERGAHLLPATVVFHRSYIAFDAQLGANEQVSDWTESAAPFQISSARARHLLLPDD